MKLSKKRLFEILKSEEGKKLIDKDVLSIVEKEMSPDELLESIDKELRHMLTEERLKEVLEYNPYTGDFTWNKGFEISNDEYYNKDMEFIIEIDEFVYKAHRLAVLYMEGFIPPAVFHINHDMTQNQYENLVPDRSGQEVKPLELWNPVNPVRRWELNSEEEIEQKNQELNRIGI